MKKLFYTLLVTCAGTFALLASGNLTPQSRKLAQDAVSKDASTSAPAIQSLRALGKDGLQALVAEHSDLLQQYSAGRGPEDQGRWDRLKVALDSVGQQKDCHASKLYWFNDLAQAKAEAAKTGRPILSLRMLGKLNEEFSCANSRFFRTTLYPNPEVSKYLSENFVLHWQSVRPVPIVTIDFGDGRKIERTITGNSVHYVLHSDGTPIDALPGLYSAKEFLKGLGEARKVATSYQSAPTEAARAEILGSYHQQRLLAVTKQSALDRASVGATAAPVAFVPVSNQKAPDAGRAMNLAFSKGGVERKIVGTLVAGPGEGQGGSIEKQMSDPVWSKIAALHYADVKLDKDSARLIKAKNPTAAAAGNLSISKMFSEAPVLRVMSNLERSIAEDTIRNEYVLHPEIHRWFINRNSTANIDQLNRKVYAELFLTPDSDPWLGLVPADTFSALQNDGVVIAQ